MSTDTNAPQVTQESLDAMMQGLLEEMNMTLPQLRLFVYAAVDVVIAYDTGMSIQMLIRRLEALRETMP